MTDEVVGFKYPPQVIANVWVKRYKQGWESTAWQALVSATRRNG